jgi:hypothetical protein
LAYNYTVEFGVELPAESIKVEADNEKQAERKAAKAWKDSVKLQVIKVTRQ